VSGVQQSVDHVEDEQRLHSLVGKAFPSFGEGEIAETARMSDEAAISGLMHRRRVLRPAWFGKRWHFWTNHRAANEIVSFVLPG